MTKRIETVPALVKAFGGTGAMAEFLDIVPSAVSNMIAANHVPRGYHLQIYLEAQRRGLSVDIQLFGLRFPEVEMSPERVPA